MDRLVKIDTHEGITVKKYANITFLPMSGSHNWAMWVVSVSGCTVLSEGCMVTTWHLDVMWWKMTWERSNSQSLKWTEDSVCWCHCFLLTVAFDNFYWYYCFLFSTPRVLFWTEKYAGMVEYCQKWWKEKSHSLKLQNINKGLLVECYLYHC